MTRLFSYGPFRPFSSLSSAQYLQYTPSSKVETALKNPHKKLGNHFKTASQQRMQIHSLLLAVSFSLIANSYIRKSRARNESPPVRIFFPVNLLPSRRTGILRQTASAWTSCHELPKVSKPCSKCTAESFQSSYLRPQSRNTVS